MIFHEEPRCIVCTSNYEHSTYNLVYANRHGSDLFKVSRVTRKTDGKTVTFDKKLPPSIAKHRAALLPEEFWT